jgi:acetyl-CoA carboxylase carboxyl transferase subunit beta
MGLAESQKNSQKMSIPSDLLFKCPRCQKIEFMDLFEQNNKVCSGCNYHARLSAKERLKLTADNLSLKDTLRMTSVKPIIFEVI